LNDRTIKPRPNGIVSNNGLAARFKSIAGKQLQMLMMMGTIKMDDDELDDDVGLKN